MSLSLAILGLGVVSPIGVGADAFWDGVVSGREAQTPIDGFDVTPLPARTGLQVRATDFDAGELLGRKGLKYVDRVSQFALAATQLALQDAGIDLEAIPAERRGIVLGTAFGSLASQQDLNRERITEGPAWVSPMKFPNTPINALSYQIPIRHQMRLANVTIPAGSVSALEAMRYSMTLLAREPDALVLTGGVEELSFLNYYSAAQRGLLAGRSGTERSRPLDRGRDGAVFGEGAAVFAVSRPREGRPALALIDGYGRGFADPGGDEEERASAIEASMRAALGQAGCAPGDVGLAVLSANSSRAGDLLEARAVERVFGQRGVPVTAPKAVLGETFGASGAFGIAVAVLAITRGMLPPVHHLDDPDPACTVNAVPPPGVPGMVSRVLVNAVDDMGGAASLVIRRTGELA
jgi:3-oxoacyl-[acyl-carrier-protein] synthase II